MKMWKKIITLVLIATFVFNIAPNMKIDAKKKVKLNRKSITISLYSEGLIRLKNGNCYNVKWWKSSNKKIVKVFDEKNTDGSDFCWLEPIKLETATISCKYKKQILKCKVKVVDPIKTYLPSAPMMYSYEHSTTKSKQTYTVNKIYQKGKSIYCDITKDYDSRGANQSSSCAISVKVYKHGTKEVVYSTTKYSESLLQGEMNNNIKLFDKKDLGKSGMFDVEILSTN